MLHRLLRICKAVVDIWVSIRAETGDPATTAAVDDLSELKVVLLFICYSEVSFVSRWLAPTHRQNTCRAQWRMIQWNFCGNSSCLFVRLSLNSRLFVSSLAQRILHMCFQAFPQFQQHRLVLSHFSFQQSPRVHLQLTHDVD